MNIAIVTNDFYSVWLFRKGLIKRLKGLGHSVSVIAAPDDAHAHLVGDMGVEFIQASVHRFMSPIKDMGLLREYAAIFRRRKFDIVHTFTIKPNLYGILAARAAGIKHVISSVTGLGYLFSEDRNTRLRIMRFFIIRMLRFALGISRRVSFQNREDMDLFVKAGIVKPNRAVLIKSSGVNLKEYSMDAADQSKLENLRREMGIDESHVVVSMIVARITWEKGVREFAEAAHSLAPKYPELRFVFAGPIEKDTPNAVPEEYLRSQDASYFKWIGFRHDVREVLALSDVVVLPSYYREGVPRILLEAMAMERPVITTDNVGCRETVDDGINGFMIPVRDPEALACAIEKFAKDPTMRKEFGWCSREKARLEFDEQKVVDDTLRLLYQFPV